MAGFFDDITARRSGVLDRLSAGEPVDPAEREQLDQISTASQGEFRKGLRRAGYNASATTSASLGQLTEPFAPDFAARQFDQAESYTQNQPANLRPEVESFRGAKDAESAGQFASGALGEAATSIAGMVAAGLAARFGLGGALRLGATGKNIAQFGGSMAAMLPQESGETALSLRQNPEAMANTTPAERAALSFGRGTVNAALESVVPNALLTNTISGAAGRIAAGVRPALTNVARKSAAGVVGEGATEGAQELTGQYAENLADPNAGYNRERVLEAAVRGAISGGVLGGAGGTVQAVRSNIDAAAETAAQKAREQVGTADQIFERIDNLIRNPEESGYDMTNTTMGALVEAQARVNELGREAAERAGPAAASGMEAIAAIRANFDRAVAGQLTPENRQRYAELTQNFRLLQPTEFERLRTAFDSGDATQINEAVGDVAFQLKERVPRETMDGLKNLTNWAKKFGSGVTRAAREGRKAAQAYDENDVRRFRSLLQEQYPDISETLDLLDSPISGKLTRALLAFRDKPELLHPESPQRIDPGLLGELVEKKTGATFPEVVAALRTQYNKKLTKAEKRAALAETSVSPTARRTETMELLLTDSMKEYLAENGLEVGPGATDTPDDTVEYIPASTTGSFGTELEKAIYRDDNERVDVEDTRRTPFNSLEQVRKLLGADILTKTDGTLINRPVNKDKRYTLTAVLRSDEEGITPQIIGRMLGGKESRSKGYDAKGKSLGFDGRPMGINDDTLAMRTTEDGGYRQEFNTIDIAAQAGTPQERGGSRENFEGFVPEFENNHRDLNIQGYRLLSAIASLQSEGIDIPRAEVPQDVVESLVAGTVDKVVGENATAAQRADALNKAVEQWREGDNIQLKVELPQDSLSEDTIVQKKGSRAVTLGDLLGANRGARSLQAQYTLMTELGENPSGKLDLIQKGKEPLRELAKARVPGHDEFMAVLTNDEAFAAMSEEEQQAALDKREKRHAALVKEKARQIKLTADALRKGLWGFSAEREANQGNDLKESRGAALATILNKYAPAYVEELNYRITNAESKQRATYNLQQLKEGYREGMFTADDIKDYIVALGPPTPNERTEDAQLEFDPAVIESIDEFLVKEWADQLKLDYTGGGDLLNILEEFDNGWLMTELDQQNRFENPDPTTSEPTQDEIFNAAMKTSPEGTETRLNKRGIDKQNDAQVRAEMEAAAQRAGAQEIRAANEDIAAGEATERQAEVNAAVAESEQERLQRRRAEMKAAREAAMSQKSVVSTKRKAAQDPIQKETNKDSNIKSRVDTIEKMLNSGEENPHHTTADPTMRNLIEMFRKGVFTASMGERQISRPFDPAIMEEAVDIYERNMAYWRAKKAANLKDWDPDPPEVKALYVHTDDVRELYTNTVERYLEEEDATPQVDPAKVTDGQAFPQANFEWTTKKAGEEYENYNLCRTCADRTARMLRKAGLPAATAHIGQKDFSGKTNKIGDHTVALTRINGVEYIVDQPQREMFAPASPPRANVGVIQSPEFTPRFIENTLENVKALYGADRVAALAGNVEFEAPISSPATQQEAVAQPQETRQQRIERIQRERKTAQTKQSVVKTKRETPQPEAKGVLTKREGETNKEFIQRMKAQQQPTTEQQELDQEAAARDALDQQRAEEAPPPLQDPILQRIKETKTEAELDAAHAEIHAEILADPATTIEQAKSLDMSVKAQRTRIKNEGAKRYAQWIRDNAAPIGENSIRQKAVNQWAEKYLPPGAKVKVVEFQPDDPDAQYFAEVKVGRTDMSRIRGMALAASVSDVLGDGSSLIFVEPRTGNPRFSQMSILAHEFGHLIQNEMHYADKAAWNSVLKMYKESLEDDFVNTLSASRLFEMLPNVVEEVERGLKTPEQAMQEGRTYLLNELNNMETEADVRNSVYKVSFGEWFAEQFARYAMNDESVFTQADPEVKSHLDRILSKMKRFFNDVVKKYFAPNQTFAEYIESLAARREELGARPDRLKNIRERKKLERQMTDKGVKAGMAAKAAREKGQEPPPPPPQEPDEPTPPPPPPPEEPPGGTPDNPVPPPPPPPDNEAQARFRATVKRLMGDRVDVAFDQDLPEGVAAEYQNRWGMDLENTAKALDAIYERRRELLREIKKTEAILNDPNNKIPFDELPDPMAMRNEVASLEEQAQAYRADLAVRGTIRVAAGMEDQAGLAEHESFHAAFEIFFGEDNANDRKVVTTAFTRGVLANRLQKYFAGNEEVLAVIDPTSPTFSAEEAAAYAFQVYLHEPGALQMGEKVEGIFNRFLRYLQKLVGYQTYEDRAKTIFNDLNSGRRSERGVSVLRDQPGMEKSMLNRSQDFVKAVGTGFMHMYDTVLSSSYSRLADSGNVAMAQIARLGYNETGERGQGMIQLQRLATTQWSNRLKTSLHALTAEELSQLNQAMVMNEELSGKLGEAQKRLRTLLNDVREYQTEAGVEMGFIEDYYPLVWNPDKVAADPQAFLKMLNNYPTEIAEMMKTPEEILDSILSWEDRGGEFQGVFGRDGEPVADSSRRRSLAFITAADRAKYVEDDLVTTMAHYINQSVRHAEYVRAYGQNGERLRQLMGEITGTYGGSQADVDLAKDYIDGLMGNKEVGMSRELKDLYGAATVYQNVRLLPLSVFSSLVDPLGVAVRTNSLGAAFDTFTYSIKNLFTDFRSKTNWTPDQWEQYADDMGTIDMSGTVKSIDKIYTGVTLRGKTREINDGFFKWNLLNGWVKNNHIMATKAAQLFLRRSAEGMFGEEMSAENLREVGVKPEDIMYDEALGRIRSTAPEILGYENAEQMEQQADPDDVQAAREQAQRIQQAIHKIVRQSMIQPSSAEMPSWMSNPYLAPIAHLKTFVFGFNATILNRLVYEAQRGNYNPIYYAAGYIPGMMAADFVKGLAGNGGEEPEWKKNWGLTDYVGYGVDRSGLTGTAQFFTDMNNDITRGGGGWETLAGPTIEQAHDLMAAMNGKTSEPTKTWMLNAMPVNDLYDQWVMP